MSLSPGQRVSHYRVLEQIGAGGMGVVFRARDENLERDVALKVLPEGMLADEEARARFRKEALALSRLNHPNIAAVYDFGSEFGTDFLVMEFVPGETLSEKLKPGPLSEKEVLDLAVQLADGLAAAHQEGVVHRDLKPANLRITPQGRLKILDFGLAKMVRQATEATRTETLTHGLVGTLAYMAPEQLREGPVDGRTDVYGAGAVLYEMASGTRCFDQQDTASLLYAIAHGEPRKPRESNPKVSPALETVILKCLEKEPERRYQSAEELGKDLERLGAGMRVAARRRLRLPSRVLGWSVGTGAVLVVALAVGFFAWKLAGRNVKVLPPVHRQITFSGTANKAMVSPDGQFINYVEPDGTGGERLIVQDLAGGRPLEVFSAPSIFAGRWSPDGTELFVTTITPIAGTATGPSYIVPRLGGAPREFPSWQFASWSPDGKKIAGVPSMQSRKIEIVDKATGEQRSIPIDVPSGEVNSMNWSPRGNLLVFGLRNFDEQRHSIWTIPANGGRPTRVVEEKTGLVSAKFSPDGGAVYYMTLSEDPGSGSLRKVRIDGESGRALGEPMVVLSGLDLNLGVCIFSFSRDGKGLFYTRTSTRSNLWLAELDGRVEGGVKTTQLTSGTWRDVEPRFSPDDRSVVFFRGNNLFLLRLDGGAPKQLTFGDTGYGFPVWSPDGGEIAFMSREGGTLRPWKMGSDGRNPRPLGSSRPSYILAWAPGRSILCADTTRPNLILLDPGTGEETRVLKEGSWKTIGGGDYSPDGTRAVFNGQRAESPDRDADRASPRSSAGGIWVVSLDDSVVQRIGEGTPGTVFGWSPDGVWLYGSREPMTARGGHLHPVIWKASLRGGPAVEVAKLPFGEVDDILGMGDVAHDGTRFAFSVVDARSDIWKVENFDPDLQRN